MREAIEKLHASREYFIQPWVFLHNYGFAQFVHLANTLADKILDHNAEEDLLAMLKIYKRIRQRELALENVPCCSKSESSNTSGSTTTSDTPAVRVDAVGSVSQARPNERDCSASTASTLSPSPKEKPNVPGSSRMRIKVESEDTIVWKPRNTRQEDLIKIGNSGRTWMKKKDYDKIKFNNYKRATRTILMGVFGSRTLATHTRSGKTCPIYKNTTDRKVKPQLPEVPLEDIRMEIRKHFNGLADELINESITTKCADEGRKYKNTSEVTEPED